MGESRGLWGRGEVHTEASTDGSSSCMRGDRIWAGEDPAMPWGGWTLDPAGELGASLLEDMQISAMRTTSRTGSPDPRKIRGDTQRRPRP